MFLEEAKHAQDVASVDPDWAWAPYQPDAQRPWNLRRAGHLYRRTSFGASWRQLQTALQDGPQLTIDKILTPTEDLADFNDTYDNYEASTDRADNAGPLRAWWLRRMIESPQPLLENMTLCWHNHFAISNVKVNSSRLMRGYTSLLRRHAFGRFETLLEALFQDPALFVGLDCTANRKSLPNDNLARGLFESFTLGANNFGEQDVREASRAFTGWFVLRNELRFLTREHDDGAKRILGQKGNFAAQDIVAILLQQPATSRLLVRKLYRWFVDDGKEPSDALLQPLLTSFQKEHHVGKLVETMLRSNWFFSAHAYRRKAKHPVEFALGIVKGLEGIVPTAPLGEDLADLGQSLLHPPTIQGWAGGANWFPAAAMLGRSNLAADLVSGAKRYGDRLDPLAVAKRHGFDTAEAAGQFLLELFVQGDLPPTVVDALNAKANSSGGDELSEQLRRLTHDIVTTPEFQLS